MTFSATINLAGIDDAGLSDKTDLADWVILEYIADWYTVPKATKRADKVWINYRHLIDQIPIIGIKSKSAVSARIHKLAALGLLIVEQDDDGRMFASLGQVAIDVRCFRVDRSPDRPGVLENERAVLENERGGVRLDEHSIENHISLENQTSLEEPQPSTANPSTAETRVRAPARPDGVSASVWRDFLAVRKAKRSPVTEIAMQGILREAGKAGITLEQAMTVCIERSWQGFRADWYVEQRQDKNSPYADRCVI